MMKVFSMIFLIVMIMSTQAFALLGDTERKSRVRYGNPVGEENPGPYEKVLFYASGLYDTKVRFRSGKSVVEVYQMKDKGKISIERLERLLRGNGEDVGGKNVWYFKGLSKERNEINFIDKKGKTVATYNLDVNSLMVKSLR